MIAAYHESLDAAGPRFDWEEIRQAPAWLQDGARPRDRHAVWVAERRAAAIWSATYGCGLLRDPPGPTLPRLRGYINHA